MATANADKQLPEGRRVKLRPLSAGDAAELFALIEASRDALKRRLRWVADVRKAKDVQGFLERGGDVWGVVELKSGRLLGVGSLTAVGSDEEAQRRLGLWIAADRHDKGLGTEAGRLLLDHGFRRLGAHRLSARLDPANRSFRRVLKKLGFRYEGCLRDERRLNGRWVDQECWGMLKTERKK